VIAAIGQNTTVAELTTGKVPNFLPPGEMLNLTRWKTIQVNEQTFETSVEGVFSGGDVVTGAATAIEAIAAGRKAAHAIEAYLTHGKAEPEPWEFFSRRDTFGKVTVADLPTRQSSAQRPMPLISIESGRPASSRSRRLHARGRDRRNHTAASSAAAMRSSPATCAATPPSTASTSATSSARRCTTRSTGPTR